jgi:AbiV family abortive infection protein
MEKQIELDKFAATLESARGKILYNAHDLIKLAVKMFEQESYPVSCFLAMTSIEEIGKLILFRPMLECPDDSTIEVKGLNKIIRNHIDKAITSAAWSLYINAGADRRHGTHPLSKIHRTSGVILLARSGRWMNIRNSCLYIDVNLSKFTSSSPKEVISREHAYYFICMAFEILAEHAQSGIDPTFKSLVRENGGKIEDIWIKFDEIISKISESSTSDSVVDAKKLSECMTEMMRVTEPYIPKERSEGIQFCNDRLEDLTAFMKQWSSAVNIDKLDFLLDPEPLIKIAEERESKNA